MSTIIAGQDGGGFRHFLDGEAVHAGDGMEMLSDGHWLRGRYEMNYHQKAGFFICSIADEERWFVIDDSMEFRRPRGGTMHGL